jgi:threonine-phosphate decarboxylase
MLNGHGDDIYNYEGIRMNFSSNIYAHADLSGLEAHLCRHIDLVRSYPEPSPRSLEKMIAQRCGVSPDEVLVTSGATDAIYLIAQAFRFVHAVVPQQPLPSLTFKVFPPTFSEYEDACRVFGYQESDDAALCWLCNPNNPTGEVFPFSHIEELASKHALLVLDQSYEDYTLAPMLSAKTAVSMGNVLQIHSMTKQYAIPGLRLGYVVGASLLIRTLRTHFRPWSVNALAIEGAKYLLRLNPPLIPSLDTCLQETQRLRQALSCLAGIDCADTQTNFFLCTIHPQTAAELKDYLAREHRILIRDASNFRGLTPHHFRIATQSPEENDLLVDAINQFIQLQR